MSFVRQTWDSVEEITIANYFKAADFSCQDFEPKIPSEAGAYENNDEDIVIYKNYAMDNDDQIPGWEDISSNGSLTDYVSCDVELCTCESEQKEYADSESSEDDEETEIELKEVTFQEAVCRLNTLKNFILSHEINYVVLTELERTKDKQLLKVKPKNFFLKCQ